MAGGTRLRRDQRSPPFHALRDHGRHTDDGIVAVHVEFDRIPHGQPHDRRAHVPPRPVGHLHAPLRTLLYADTDGDTKLAVDQPSLLFASYGNPDIAAVGNELDGLLAALVELLGGDVPDQLRGPGA
jgi:hypothetical protein